MAASFIEKKLNELVDQLRKKAVAAQKEAAEELSEEIKQEVKVKLSPVAREMVRETFVDAVSKWYEAFEGTGKYKRTKSLYSILRFDTNTDQTVSWGYYDDDLWHPSIFRARDEEGNDLGDAYAYYNIYDMAFVRGSHGNELFNYFPVITESPLSQINARKPYMQKELSVLGTQIAQQYADAHYHEKFRKKFSE